VASKASPSVDVGTNTVALTLILWQRFIGLNKTGVFWMQTELQIRESLKHSVDRLVIRYRMERMARRLAWVGAIATICCLFLSIASLVVGRASW
jgi:hypothetical protein